MRAKTTLVKSRHLSPAALLAAALLAQARQACEPDPWFRVSGGRSAFSRGMEDDERGVTGVWCGWCGWQAGVFSPSRMCRRQKCQNIEARKTLASPSWSHACDAPSSPSPHWPHG